MNPTLQESATFAWTYVIFFYAYYEITCIFLFKCVIKERCQILNVKHKVRPVTFPESTKSVRGIALIFL